MRLAADTRPEQAHAPTPSCSQSSLFLCQEHSSPRFPCKASAVLSRPRRQTQHSKPPELRTMPTAKARALSRERGTADRVRHRSWWQHSPESQRAQVPTCILSVGSRPWGSGSSYPPQDCHPTPIPVPKAPASLLYSDVRLTEEDTGHSLSWVWFWPRIHPDLDGLREVLSQSSHYLLPPT